MSEITENRVNKWTEENGVEIYLEPSGFTDAAERGGEPGSNGLIIDEEGTLVLCQHGDRRVARMNAALDQPVREFISIADQCDGALFNSANDGVGDRRGSLHCRRPQDGPG